MRLKNHGAFTLFETIIAVFLLTIIMACIFTVLATAKNSLKSGESRLNVQQESRRGLREIVRELRQTSASTITGVPADGLTYNSITFQIPVSIGATGTTWSSNIQYSLGGLNSAQLLRTQSGNQTVLANNISALTFSRGAATPNIVNINITAQKNTFAGFTGIQSNLTLNTEVKIRN